MGNSLPREKLIRLGGAAIFFEKKKSIWRQKESWNVMYSVGPDSCLSLTLERFGKDGDDVNVLKFTFYDNTRQGGLFQFCIKRGEKDLLEPNEFFDFGGFCDMTFVNETCDSWGGITKMNAYFHGSGRGLLVVEEKRKSGDEMPCTVTVAHYYAARTRDLLRQIDIGLSMVVDIRVSNNQLVVSEEGPLQHPSSALLSMFQQVSRTRTWNRMTCPHCAETQRQHSGSEAESDEDRNKLLIPAPLHSPRKNNGGTILANEGAIRGNNNGNFIVHKLFLR